MSQSADGSASSEQPPDSSPAPATDSADAASTSTTSSANNASATATANSSNIRIAVVGCTHGEVSAIYQTIDHIRHTQLPPNDNAIDLILCCGDFQSIRDAADLQSMAVPQKYKQLGEFQHYYHSHPSATTTTQPPPPLLFIGGNHEASNYLATLYLGGYVSPHIYYMGHSNVLHFAGLTIAGLSGIYKSHDYHRGHDERLPLQNEKDVRSVYHVRRFDVEKLVLYHQAVQSHNAPPIDIMLSHDWPAGIEHHGNTNQLLKRKPFFRSDIEKGELGSPPAMDLLHRLQPSHWFSAHLHTKFPAVVNHAGSNKQTKFLALDKCVPGRDWLQILQIPCSSTAPRQLSYSPEWLAITTAALPHLSLTRKQPSIPMNLQWQQYVEHIQQRLQRAATTPSHDRSVYPTHLHFPGPHAHSRSHPNTFSLDPQTTALLQILQQTDPFTSPKQRHSTHTAPHFIHSKPIDVAPNDEELTLDDPDAGHNEIVDADPTASVTVADNDEEIELE